MKLKIEFAVLFLFALFFLYFGYGMVGDHTLKHDFPYGYLASDTFQHQVRTSALQIVGNYRFEAPWIVAGYADTVGFYPPVLYHLGAALSYAAGIETYDSAYFIIFLFALFGSLILYVLLKRWNPQAALIALPFCLLLFATGSLVGFTWGSWPSLLSQAFLLLFAWSILYRQNPWITAIALSAVALTHTSEIIFAGLFWGALLTYRWVSKSLSKDDIISALKTGLIFMCICIYYLLIFFFTWAKAQPYQYSVVTDWGNTPIVTGSSFGFLFALMIVGIVLLWTFKESREIGIFATLMLLLGYSNYIGFDVRAFQLRQFWPLYLGIAAACTIATILSFLKSPKIMSSVLSITLCIGIVFAIQPLPGIQKSTSPGVMNPYHWNLLKGVASLPEGKVLFVYGDIYDQNALLRNGLHAPYMILKSDYISAVQNATIKRSYVTRLLGDHHGVYYAYQKSLFSYGYHALEVPKDEYHKAMDVCAFDYVVIDVVSQQRAFAEYNKILGSLLVNASFTPVFNNEVGIVLRNSHAVKDCLPAEGVYLG